MKPEQHMDDSRIFLLRGYATLANDFSKTGKSVATPVWFAGDDRVLYVWTNAHSGKVKRLKTIRRSPWPRAPITASARPGRKGVAHLPESEPEARIADRSLSQNTLAMAYQDSSHARAGERFLESGTGLKKSKILAASLEVSLGGRLGIGPKRSRDSEYKASRKAGRGLSRLL
jgi:hypothetical protein